MSASGGLICGRAYVHIPHVTPLGRCDGRDGFPVSAEAENFIASAAILAEPYAEHIADLEHKLAEAREGLRLYAVAYRALQELFVCVMAIDAKAAG